MTPGVLYNLKDRLLLLALQVICMMALQDVHVDVLHLLLDMITRSTITTEAIVAGKFECLGLHFAALKAFYIIWILEVLLI